jgi:diacylglycerol O-acyltransferase / wax synthase
MVPLAKNQGVCIGIMSYDGQVNFGLIGDYDGMPDLDDLAEDLEDAIGELIEAAGGRPGMFRRFIPRAESKAAGQNGHSEREESTTG